MSISEHWVLKLWCLLDKSMNSVMELCNERPHRQTRLCYQVCRNMLFCSRMFCTWFKGIQTYPETLIIDFWILYFFHPILAFSRSGVLSLVLYWSLILQVDPFEWELFNCDQLSCFHWKSTEVLSFGSFGFEMWMEWRRKNVKWTVMESKYEHLSFEVNP